MSPIKLGPPYENCPDIDLCETSMGCLRLSDACACHCREGECESKPTHRCRIADEIGTKEQ